jgi:drug/metabolite transporter (DMT)-like permease
LTPAPDAPAPWRVQLLLLVVVVAWGLNIPAVKALSGRMDVIWVASLRMAVAALALTVCVLLRNRPLPRPDRRQLAGLVAAGVLMVYVNQLLFVTGMSLASATGASLVMGLSPALSVAVTALVFRERLTARRLAALAAGFAGVALVVLQRDAAGAPGAGLGELIVLVGLLTFVLGGAIVQQLARRLDALSIGWVVYSSGAALLMAHALAFGDPAQLELGHLDGSLWLLVLYSGVLGTALSGVGWYQAIARVGMARASVYLSWLPVFGVTFSALMLGEPLTPWHVAGVVLVIAATRLGTSGR